MIYPVPEVFQAPDTHYYPSDNFPDFEYWLMLNIKEEELMYGDRVYLPILFTAYFKRNQYGKNQPSIDLLQRFVDTLPPDKKYFTVVQYDDGVLVDWKGKDVVVFGMSGKPENCIPIPLICQPHKYQEKEPKKDILISFVGRVTHPSRQSLMDWGVNKSDCYISTRAHTLDQYCDILWRSQYVFCLRGYGAGSFRVCEALQYGAMPIIMKSVFDRVYMCPFSIICSYHSFSSGELDYVYRWVKRKPPPRAGIFNAYQQYYTFEGVKKTIFNSLWNLL